MKRHSYHATLAWFLLLLTLANLYIAARFHSPFNVLVAFVAAFFAVRSFAWSRA